MFEYRPLLTLFLCSFLGCFHLNGRIWLDDLGCQLEAEFVEADESTATVKRISDGRIFKIKLSKLSSVDQDFVSQHLESIKPIESRPDENAFHKYQDYFKRFNIEKKSFEARYLGTMGISEVRLGEMPVYPRSLAYTPDSSRIAVSHGNGTTPNMQIFYWDAENGQEEIFPLTYQKYEKGLSLEERADLEKQGILWFFGGQIAINKKGNVFLSLGACGGNGIFEVTSNGLDRLNDCISSSTLQIPAWDSGTAYLGRSQAIYKFELKSNEALDDGEFFSLDNNGVYISDALILDKNRIILSVSCPTKETDERGLKISERFSILVDGSERGYYFLKDAPMGAMALSPDGSKMVRYNTEIRSLVEFTLNP